MAKSWNIRWGRFRWSRGKNSISTPGSFFVDKNFETNQIKGASGAEMNIILLYGRSTYTTRRIVSSQIMTAT